MTSWRQRVRELESENESLREEIRLMKKTIEMLQNVIHQYNNPNTPSSKLPDYKKEIPKKKNNQSKPKGKPVGSNGGTRELPEPDEEKVVRLSEKEEHYYGEPIKYISKVVCEIPNVTPVKWTKYHLAQYVDPISKVIITAADPSCPTEGIFGPNLRSIVVLLRERFNLSEEQTIEFLEGLHNLSGVAPATIEAEIRRTASILKPNYDAIGSDTADAPIKHSDETTQSLNGKRWTLYALSTETSAYYFAQEKKRAEHIKQRLRDPINNVLVCDGHAIYDWYHTVQRCWSHATRKVDYLLKQGETEERLGLNDAICGSFHRAKEYLKKGPPGPEQIWNVLRLKNRMDHYFDYGWKEKECQKAIQYMINGLEKWFTFMFVPGVPPTNNMNERDIRKHVMKRKISGTFRSEEGLHNHCIVLSILQTWRKQNKNVFRSLTEQIRLHNSRMNHAA